MESEGHDGIGHRLGNAERAGAGRVVGLPSHELEVLAFHPGHGDRRAPLREQDQGRVDVELAPDGPVTGNESGPAQGGNARQARHDRHGCGGLVVVVESGAASTELEAQGAAGRVGVAHASEP